jgi:Flp pilus assembly protein TadG
MLFRPLRTQRRGTVLVETAIVFSVVIALTVGMVVVGLGIFSYQQTAWMAREGARWISMRGSQYNTDTGNAVATTSSLKQYLSHLGDLDSVTVYLGNNSDGWTLWDSCSSWPTTNASSGNQNWVKVKVTYHWTAYLGNITMGSTAQVPMSN